MNACEPLVSTVDEIAITAKVTIATRAAEKANAHALTDRPALNAGTEGIYASDDFVAWEARPVDRKRAFNGARIGMADAACLDAYPHLTGSGTDQWFPYGREFSRLRDLNCSVRIAHRVLLSSVFVIGFKTRHQRY